MIPGNWLQDNLFMTPTKSPTGPGTYPRKPKKPKKKPRKR